MPRKNSFPGARSMTERQSKNDDKPQPREMHKLDERLQPLSKNDDALKKRLSENDDEFKPRQDTTRGSRGRA